MTSPSPPEEIKVMMFKIRPAYGGSWVLLDIEGIKSELRNYELEDMEDGYEVQRYKEMTESELNELPEFDGW